jgi:DNA-binding SARP family transcriptional activator
MEFRLLGEVELRAGGQLLEIGAPRLQAVLAALAVDPRRPVAIETLIDRVWDDTPPIEARNVLYSYLSRIRRLLRQASLAGETTARIERRPAGYVLDIDPDLVDLHRFRRLVDQGGDREHGDDTRSTALAEALGLWRGPALAGLPGRWAAQVRDGWYQRRLDAMMQWAQIKLRLGHPAAVITTLPDLAAEYPLVEPLETLLMQALHTAGRGAEALERYSAIRQRLADELGADPGPELRALHQAVLQGEPPASAERTVPRPQPATSTSSGARHGPELAPAGNNESPAEPPGHINATATDSPPRQARSRLARRGAVLTALVAVILLATIGSVRIFNRDKVDDSPSVEQVQALFDTAEKFDQEGRAENAQETTVDAVQLYDKLVTLNPDQNALPLAPAVIKALRRVGVDFSVDETALRSWLGNPAYTPYPAIAQEFLLQGWRLKRPVYIDVFVWNYEQTPGVTSPRNVADVRTDVLKGAVVAGSNARYGTGTTGFEQLLEP